MPLDPSIALQTQVANPTTMISSFLDLGKKKLDLDKARATYDADVAGTKALSSSAQSKATVDQANVQPLIQQQAAQTQQAQNSAASSGVKLNMDQLAAARAHTAQVAQQAQELMDNPDITRGDVMKAVTGTLSANNAPTAAWQQAFQGMPDPVSPEMEKTPEYKAQLKAYVKNISARTLGQMEQINLTHPAPQNVTDGYITQARATGNQDFTGVQPGTPVGVPIRGQVPIEQRQGIGTDSSGRQYGVSKTADGRLSTGPLLGANEGGAAGGGGGPVNLPRTEDVKSASDLDAERQRAQDAAKAAPEMHQINRQIMEAADKGVMTGALGHLGQKISSATGYMLGGEQVSDLNSLGKQLARSNQKIGAAMGIHTDAGAANSAAANGTTDYDEKTIKHVASQNEALTTGAEMYQEGLEKARVENGLAGQRKFQQQWSGTFSMDAMELKNAAERGDTKQVKELIDKAGGRGSPGAVRLYQKYEAMHNLVGRQ